MRNSGAILAQFRSPQRNSPLRPLSSPHAIAPAGALKNLARSSSLRARLGARALEPLCALLCDPAAPADARDKAAGALRHLLREADGDGGEAERAARIAAALGEDAGISRDKLFERLAELAENDEARAKREDARARRERWLGDGTEPPVALPPI